MTFARSCRVSRLYRSILLAVLATGSLATATFAERPTTAPSTQGTQAKSEPTDRVANIRRVLLDPTNPQVLVVAHRGHVATAPENSLAAIRAAVDVGAHIAEIDVARTADGFYVLMHDKTLNRTTTGKGPLLEHTLADVRKLQLVSSAIRPSAETVPTLGEAFDAARGRILLNLDPKDLSIPEAAAIAREESMLDHCVFKLAWPKVDTNLKAWLKANPDVFFMPICNGMDEVRAALAEHPWPVIEVTFTDLNDPIFDPAEIRKLVDAGTRLWINALSDGRWSAGISDRQGVRDPVGVYGRLADRGFGIIQTDLADVVIPTLRARDRLPAE